MINQTAHNQVLQTLIVSKLASDEDSLSQFVVDPTVDPDVISCIQQQQFNIIEIMKLTRTFCYGIHRRRLKMIGLLVLNLCIHCS